MKKSYGWQGCYFLNSANQVVAKTCFKCRKILLTSEFTKGNSTGKLQSSCRKCIRASEKDLKTRSDKEIESYRNKKYPKGLKFCNSCDSLKTLLLFSPNRTKLDGLQGRCRDCHASYGRSHGSATDDSGVTNYHKATQRYLSSNRGRSPEEMAKDRGRLNPTGLKTCSSCGISKHFNEFYLSRSKPDGLTYECIHCHNASRIARMKKCDISHWTVHGIPLDCYVCGDPWEHSDHVVAKNHGGSDEPYNRLPICQPCNSSKGDHPLEAWLVRKFPEIADDIIRKVTDEYGMEI